MKDPQIKYYENKAVTYWQKNKTGILLTAAIILCIIAPIATCYYIYNPAPPVTVVTDKQIKEQVSHDVKEPTQKIDSFKRVVTDSARMLKTAEQRLYAAQQKIKELSSKINTTQDSRNGTAEELTETLDAGISVSNNCDVVVNNLHSQLDNKDSIITQTELQRDIFKHGFNDMALNSQEKDRAIRDLNRKLRVKKVTGFVKTAAIVAAVVYVIVKK